MKKLKKVIHVMLPKMKGIIVLCMITMILILSNATIPNVEGYTATFDGKLALKVIQELPYNWYYSFNSYSTGIDVGISLARNENVTLFYSPDNATGPLIDNSVLAYNNLIKQLDNGDIKSAVVEFGKLVSYVIYLSDPFRTNNLKNVTLAQKFESLILENDVSNVIISKNITVTNIAKTLASIGIKAVELSNNLNKTALAKSIRDDSYSKFISQIMSYTASVLYAILMKAINEHANNTSAKNLYYIIAFTGIILALVIFANRKRLKSIRKK
jgi:hypothetical protein